VLIIGIDAAGVEIAKNLALCGVKRLSLIDESTASIDSLLG